MLRERFFRACFDYEPFVTYVISRQGLLTVVAVRSAVFDRKVNTFTTNHYYIDAPFESSMECLFSLFACAFMHMNGLFCVTSTE